MKFTPLLLLLCLPQAAAASSPFEEHPLGRVLRTTRVIPIDLAACKDGLQLEGRDWYCEPGSEQYDEDVAGGKGRVTRGVKVLGPSDHCMMLFEADANGYKIQVLDYNSAQTLSLAQARECFDLAAPGLPPDAVVTADYLEGQHPVPPSPPILYSETTAPVGQEFEVTAKFSVKEASQNPSCRTGGGAAGYGFYRSYRDCELKLEDPAPGFEDYVLDWDQPEFGEGLGCSADLSISAPDGALRFAFDVYKENMMFGKAPPTPGMGAVKLCASMRVHGKYKATVFRYPR